MIKEILEGFDSPYDYRYIGIINDEKVYEFKEGDDVFMVRILDNIELWLGYKTVYGLDVSFDKNGIEYISKSKNPFRIFATIYTIIKSYKLKDFIRFSAKKSEKSRVKLYDKLSNKLKQELGWSWVKKEEDGDGNIIYSVNNFKPRARRRKRR